MESPLLIRHTQRLLVRHISKSRLSASSCFVVDGSTSRRRGFSSTTNKHESEKEESSTTSDVLIVGGGVVGCTLADQITTQLPHLRVGLIEAGKGPAAPAVADLDLMETSHAAADESAILPHPRSYALSPASLELLRLNEDSHDHLQKGVQERLGFYHSMQVWEARQPACLSFSTADLADENINDDASSSSSSSCLGAVVEDRVLMKELWSRLMSKKEPQCQLHVESTVSKIQLPSHPSQGLVQVHLEPSRTRQQQSKEPKAEKKNKPTILQTRLLVAADGANSATRHMLGIPFAGWDYGRQALTFTVQLEQPQLRDHRRAFQRFLPSGPIALLPTYSPNHAIVVWSTTPEQVQQWKDHPDLVHHVNRLLQDGPERLESLFPAAAAAAAGGGTTTFAGDSVASNILYGMDKLVETIQYGPALFANNNAAQTSTPTFVPPPTATAVSSPQFSFPLSCRQVVHYTKPRFCVVGDAAHTVHPMAGQGLNLGLQDVQRLVAVLVQACESGMDVCTFVNDTGYGLERQAVVSATLAGIHALHGLFGEQHVVAKHAKSLGINVVQNVGPLRRALVQAACQGVSVVPSSSSS